MAKAPLITHFTKRENVIGSQEGDYQCPIPDLGDETNQLVLFL